ncbi:hypothetical protein OF117_00975 [Geodermatophilus sp. YIM 151500]|uniref:hypothetical protein n=1 Tax=Geodermatophilus sp. YIM 151500 TaxID=2984531 RepID=UPI0021E45ABD|nr:hypothetical protein [Geodermatophilus sp. YIM 151500]MCV2487920.1 hypothetical protein [Geodermatophilus sp. YIM 151500]
MIRVGKPDVKPDASAHVKGVIQGNAPGAFERQDGNHPDGTADARRSTGVNAKRRDPLIDAMPNLPPG